MSILGTNASTPYEYFCVEPGMAGVHAWIPAIGLTGNMLILDFKDKSISILKNKTEKLLIEKGQANSSFNPAKSLHRRLLLIKGDEPASYIKASDIEFALSDKKYTMA